MIQKIKIIFIIVAIFFSMVVSGGLLTVQTLDLWGNSFVAYIILFGGWGLLIGGGIYWRNRFSRVGDRMDDARKQTELLERKMIVPEIAEARKIESLEKERNECVKVGKMESINMGLYFIAAGSSSKNREKSLDKGHNVNQIEGFLPLEDGARLNNHYPSGNGVFIWGVNHGRSFRQLSNVSEGKYVVDVKNKKVVQIFKFCFYVDTIDDIRLQEYIGWDRELPVHQRRPYRYVFFLKDPKSPGKDQKEKSYFQSAFNMLNNSQWLFGQTWFSDFQVAEAMRRKKINNVEEFLGISEV